MSSSRVEDNYDRIRTVGKGAFGSAVLVKRKSDGRLFIAKEQLLPSGADPKSKSERTRAMNEVALLKAVKHPNVVRLVESFLDNNSLVMIMEYADAGDLGSRVRRVAPGAAIAATPPPFPAICFFVQILQAMSFLHTNGLLHRDIKPDNVFLTSRGVVKLGDLGVSKWLGDGAAAAAPAKHTLCGTIPYMAPELLMGRSYNSTADVWALGILLYEMIAGTVPFSSYEAICKTRVPELPSSITPAGVESDDVNALIFKLLSKTAADRPLTIEVLKYPIVVDHMRTCRTGACRLAQPRDKKPHHNDGADGMGATVDVSSSSTPRPMLPPAANSVDVPRGGRADYDYRGGRSAESQGGGVDRRGSPPKATPWTPVLPAEVRSQPAKSDSHQRKDSPHPLPPSFVGSASADQAPKAGDLLYRRAAQLDQLDRHGSPAPPPPLPAVLDQPSTEPVTSPTGRSRSSPSRVAVLKNAAHRVASPFRRGLSPFRGRAPLAPMSTASSAGSTGTPTREHSKSKAMFHSDVIRCTSCGCTEGNVKTSRFCGHCGLPLQAAPVVESVPTGGKPKACVKCGWVSPIDLDWKFCGECGAPSASVGASAPPASRPKEVFAPFLPPGKNASTSKSTDSSDPTVSGSRRTAADDVSSVSAAVSTGQRTPRSQGGLC